MPKITKPVSITSELAANYTGKDQFGRFDKAVMKILTVSHEEILRREQRAKEKASLNPNRRGPKPKKKGEDRALGVVPLS